MKKTVVVTGFGAFRDIDVNPSGLVAKELSKIGIPIDNVQLVTDEMAVDYEEVHSKVTGYWQEHCPDLVIHLGVHGVAKTINLEQQSFGYGYCTRDINDKCPEFEHAPTYKDKNPAIIQSSINCVALANVIGTEFKEKYPSLKIRASDDPGRYLCAFSFYLSLCQDKSKALFIHIPKTDNEISVAVLAEVVQKIIMEILSHEPTTDN